MAARSFVGFHSKGFNGDLGVSEGAVATTVTEGKLGAADRSGSNTASEPAMVVVS